MKGAFFMAKILVYNNNSNRMETYYRGLSEAMPYITNRTLTVNEFRGSNKKTAPGISARENAVHIFSKNTFK